MPRKKLNRMTVSLLIRSLTIQFLVYTGSAAPLVNHILGFVASRGNVHEISGLGHNLPRRELTESFTIQVAKVDERGQPVTTNVAVVVQAPRLDAQG